MKRIDISWVEFPVSTFKDFTFNTASREIRRTDKCVGLISRVPELGWAIFNIFAPLNMVFHFFDLNSTFTNMRSDWMALAVSNPETGRIFDRLLRKHKIPKRSHAVQDFLGNYPNSRGKAYDSKDGVWPSPLNGRLISFTVPLKSAEYTRDYLDRCNALYGKRSFHQFPEDGSLDYIPNRKIANFSKAEARWFGALAGTLRQDETDLVLLDELSSDIANYCQELVRLSSHGNDVRKGLLVPDFVRPPMMLKFPYARYGKFEFESRILSARLDVIEQLSWPTFYGRVYGKHDMVSRSDFPTVSELTKGETILFNRLGEVRRKLEAKYPTLTENPIAE
jgi:hypothetical protein